MLVLILSAVCVILLPLKLKLESRTNLGRQGYRFRVRPPDRNPQHTFDADAFTAVGGCRVRRRNLSVPLVNLKADRRWLRITRNDGLASWVAFPFLPRPIWIGRAEVMTCRPIWTRMGSGILFETADGAFDGVILWLFGRQAVLSELQALGWPVQTEDPSATTST